MWLTVSSANSFALLLLVGLTGSWHSGPTTTGPPLGGPTDKNRLLLGVVVLSPTQSGTTGPSPTRLVTTGSCQHTGLTCAMTTHHGSRHSGPTDNGPQLRGPTDEIPLPVGTNESSLPVGTTALSPNCSNTTKSTISRQSHQQNSPRRNGQCHDDLAPRPISSWLGLSPPQMADVSRGLGPNDPSKIRAKALALLDRAENCTSSP